MTEAKAYIETVTAPVTEWTGPTTGPKAQPDKLVIYVSDDQRNGGAKGVGEGAKEAAEGHRLGVPAPRRAGRSLDPRFRADAGDRAAARRDHPRHDRRARAGADDRAGRRAGIKVVGWHSGGAPGPIEGVPGVITNITTDPLEVAKASGLYAVVDSGGKAGVIIFTDSIYAIAIAKSDATAAAVKKCSGCKVLEIVDTPIGDLQNRMGQLTTSLLSKYGADWTYSVAVNDLYYDFSAPSLHDRPASTRPRAIRGKSPRATARSRRSSASATASTRSRPSPSRCSCTAGRPSTS